MNEISGAKMSQDEASKDRLEALGLELAMAEQQLLQFAKLTTDSDLRDPKLSIGYIGLGKGCGVSLMDLMSLCEHVERVSENFSSVLIRKGVKGHALYGPYVELDRGQYELVLTARRPLPGIVARLLPAAVSVSAVNVSTNGELCASRMVLSAREKTMRVLFDVNDQGAGQVPKYEFRLSTNGVADIVISRIQLWKIR